MTSKVEIILMTRNEHIVNVNDLDWVTDGNGDQFVFQRKWFTRRTGAKKLGCSLYRVPPGKTAFPHHSTSLTKKRFTCWQGKERFASMTKSFL